MRRVNKPKLLIPVLYSMAEGYKRQLSKYKAMLKLAEKQKEFTEAENMTKLEEAILARQELIKDLDEMNSKLKPMREDIISTLGLSEFSSTALLAAVPSKATEDLAESLSQLGDVLYTLKELDHFNEKLLREKLSQVDTKLSTAQKKNQAQKAYAKKIPKDPPKLIDKNK